jgi:hypothetical protein
MFLDMATIYLAVPLTLFALIACFIQSLYTSDEDTPETEDGDVSDHEETSGSGNQAPDTIGPTQTNLRRAHTFDTETLPQSSGKTLWRTVEQALILKGNTFSYRPIKYDKEIRILKIIRGKEEDPMECMLYPSALSSAKPRPSYKYWALSYWWGDDEPTHRITMYRDTGVREGLQKVTPFHFAGYFYVRNNLASALKHFRQKDRDVDIWVDALCINQEQSENNEEKTAQVARMNEIYSEAENVCVWLGPGNPESKKTFDFLKAILNLKYLDDLIESEANPERWMLVINLMKLKWFSVSSRNQFI